MPDTKVVEKLSDNEPDAGVDAPAGNDDASPDAVVAHMQDIALEEGGVGAMNANGDDYIASEEGE